MGQIQLRPFCGQPVAADLVRLTISPVIVDVDQLKAQCIDVWCAVVRNVHDDLILTSDAIDRFSYHSVM